MFEVKSRFDGMILILQVEGYCEAEAGTRIFNKVKETVSEKKLKGIILDFSKCKVVNSSCIAKLMETAELVVYDFKNDIVVCGLDKTKASFFKMFGMLDLAELRKDIASAKEYLSA